MTETRQWFDQRRRELARRHAGASVMLTAGLVLVVLAIGIALARIGVYRWLPVSVLVPWLGAFGVIAWGASWYRSRMRRIAVHALAEVAERYGAHRRGSIGGVAAWETRNGSSSLAALADGRATQWLTAEGARALAGVRREATTSVRSGAVLAAAGALGFMVSEPGAADSAAFWRPIAVVAPARGPVQLSVDRIHVRRGDSVTASITAVGHRTATFWVRSPGEPWTTRSLDLDTAGFATVVLGPLDSDRYLRVVARRRSSETVHVQVALPMLLTDLQLLARYPAYLERADEPLTSGEEPLPLPVGTRVVTRGQATVPVARVAWRGPDRLVSVTPDGKTFSGVLVVRQSARWILEVTPEGGGSLDEPAPVLHIIAVPDSAPLVAVLVPGADTTAPVSLRQPLVIDARDDHRLTDVELISWRASRLGVKAPPRTEAVPLPGSGTDRAVLHWVLDLNGRGFLPGDTAYFKVRAHDDAPTPQMGESPIYALRLPSLVELRQAMRDASRDVARGADSLAEEQGALARSFEDLAAERERAAGMTERRRSTRTPDQLPFNSVESARELLEKEASVLERARQLQEELRELSEAAWAAGLTDPEFHQQLRDLQKLLERALTDEIAERLRALRQALERLDVHAAREALRDLAEAARELREEFLRGRELFERAAIEGELTSLADDAEELAQRQRDWNTAAIDGVDSALAASEEALAAQADSLAAQVTRLGAMLDTVQAPGARLQDAGLQAAEAAGRMRGAARQARRGDAARARQSGEAASQRLDPLAENLRGERDQMREAWRQEVLAAMDRALVESAELAKRQADVAQQLNRGASGAGVRGAQAAVREGVDRVIEQIQTAAGKNALIPPQLGTALGYAKVRMNEALDQLQRPTPNTREAGDRAGQAVDALNAAIYALLQSRNDVAGAQSGSGLQEAIEQMLQLADQQGQLNSESGGLLSMMPMAGAQLLQDLRALAEQQRALAQALERLDAGGEVSGADALAEEATDIARELEAGRLDRELVERQERLFRRLLDAGRTLQSEDEDERKERVSETADPTNVRMPPATGSGEAGVQPRFRYPTWLELRSLSPQDRRLILDYFRRLNDRRP